MHANSKLYSGLMSTRPMFAIAVRGGKIDAALLMLIQAGQLNQIATPAEDSSVSQHQPERFGSGSERRPVRSRSACAPRIIIHHHHQLSKLTPMVESWFLPAKMPLDEIEVTLGSLALSAAARAASFQRA